MTQTKHCKECGREFEKSKNCSQKKWESRQYCSTDCMYEHRRNGTKIECPECGGHFYVSPSQTESRTFCSMECYNQHKKKHPEKFNFFEKGHKPYINKPWLGKKHSEETKKKMSESHKGQPKSEDYIKKNLEGEDHWNWQGGKSYEKYPSEFSPLLRRKIRERDNYTCQDCGLTQEESKEIYNRRLSVHHKDFNKKNNNKSNLETLCIECHKNKHHKC